MTVAVKCNITSLVLDKLNELYWGFDASSSNKNIYDNYIESLNCSTVEIEDCNSVICDNPTINFTCKLAINSMVRSIENETFFLTIPESGLTGGTPPYKYEWTFDSRHFSILSGTANDRTLFLKLKPGLSLDYYIVSKLSIKVTDAEGCKATKTCFTTREGLTCALQYTPCNNTSDLSVSTPQVSCPPVSGLIVTKK